jgi:heterodisulfide reductase subunit A2
MQGSAAAARVCQHLGWKAPIAAQPVDIHQLPAGARRIGVFACDCAGEIGTVVDLPSTMAAIVVTSDVATCQVVPFGCLREGLDAVGKAVREHGLTDVVIGACNRRTFVPLFERSIQARVHFASLREECALVHKDDPAGATWKATELLHDAVERLRSDFREQGMIAARPARTALVIGGGLSGLSAALHLADAGVRVHIVEREARLGGYALRLGRGVDGADVPGATKDVLSRAKAHKLITVHASSEIIRLAKHGGCFTAVLRSRAGRGEQDLLPELGAVIIATGGEEYRGPAYGLGKNAAVITLLDFERILREKPALPSQLKEMAFIGCVGPWDEPGSDRSWRCSRNCCETMIRQARALKEANPGCRVAVLVREANTYAFAEEQYTAARRAGVLFFRFSPAHRPRIEGNGSRRRLIVRDEALGEDVQLAPQLIALAAAILPRADASVLASRLELGLAADGFLREWEAKTQTAASLEAGIFMCGIAHGPKPVREVITQALAAAHQAAIHLSRRREVSLEEVARVDPKLCAACLTCVRVCPYGVPCFDDQNTAARKAKRTSVIDPFRCQGCGTCVAECPAGAIRLGSNDGSWRSTAAESVRVGV